MKDNALEKTKALLERYARGKKIAVAVSGGKDSVCLLDLVLADPNIRKEDVVVVNVDHGIRGETSARDSLFVAEYCKNRGVECLCHKTSVPRLCRMTGRGEEEEAREYRRKVFAEVCERRGVELVLTAHHKSDNAETVFLNIMRGSGASGIGGMALFSDTAFSAGKLFRPMLNNTRDEIDAYARANALPFVEDESNDDTKYSRNFVRKEVLPLLNRRFNAENALDTLSKRAREDDEFINKFVDETEIERTVGGYKVKTSVFFREPPIASRYALAMLRKLTNDYTHNSVQSVMDCARLESGGKREISSKITAVNEYGYVALYENIPAHNCDFDFGIGDFDFGCFTARVESAEISASDVADASRGDRAELSRTLFADADKVPATARTRNRFDGDTFRPFGGGEKKLKHFLVNTKIPQRLRGFLPLLCDGKNTLAVFGAEISPQLAVDENTKRILKLTLVKGGFLWKE